MTTPQKRDVLVFGFVREYYKSIHCELPPNDIIKLFILWVSFSDFFDKNISHQNIEIELINDNEHGEYQKLKTKPDTKSSTLFDASFL